MDAIQDSKWTFEFILSPEFQEFIDSIPEAVVISNYDGDIVQVNTVALKVFKYTRDELLNCKIEELVPKEIREKHVGLRHWFFEHPRPRFLGDRNYELMGVRRSGYKFYIDAALFALKTDKEILAINLIRDVSERKQEFDKNSADAFIDKLTGLPNRRYFEDTLSNHFEKLKRHNQPLALLFMDLDKFKPINDNLGHDIGDILLQQFSERLHKVLRKDDFGARVGGDEFVVVVSPFKAKTDLETLAKRIIDTATQPFEIEGQTLNISISIGIACLKTANVDDKTLYQRADKAMYYAKAKGGGQFYVSEE